MPSNPIDEFLDSLPVDNRHDINFDAVNELLLEMFSKFEEKDITPEDEVSVLTPLMRQVIGNLVHQPALWIGEPLRPNEQKVLEMAMRTVLRSYYYVEPHFYAEPVGDWTERLAQQLEATLRVAARYSGYMKEHERQDMITALRVFQSYAGLVTKEVVQDDADE